MPTPSHPELSIPEHTRNQRLRTDSVDVACSPRSTSILRNLWRCKSSLIKSASVGSAKELHDLSKAPETTKSLLKSSTLGNNSIQHCKESCARLHEDVRSTPYCHKIDDLQCHVEPSKENFEGEPQKQPPLQEVVIKSNTKSLRSMLNQRSKSEAVVHYVIDQDEGDLKRSATSKSGEIGIKKMQLFTMCELRRVVARLQCGSIEEQWLAADEVRRLSKDDPIARATLAMLGAISPLISMLDSLQPKHQCTALLALLNLAVGNEMNKAAIVKAKAVPKMVALLRSPHGEVQAAVVTAFLSLSALDGNKGVIGASGAVAMLVGFLSQHGNEMRQKDALRALYNLSIHPDNVKTIDEAGGVPLLLAMVEDVEMAEKSLATLSNFAGIDVGRQAITKHKEIAYAVLIDAMQWAEAPKCQERAVYVLMMIAHHNQTQREAMASAGVIPALLELALLGSPLAQKRASRTLDSFRRPKAFSAPQKRQQVAAELLPDDHDSRRNYIRPVSEKKVVDRLVRQSLHRTMQRIVKRANVSTAGGVDVDGALLAPSAGRRAFDRRSSSCSLPY